MRSGHWFRFVMAILPGFGIGWGVGLAADPARADNRIVNGDFSVAEQTAGWIENGTWSPLDWEEDPASGSVLNANTCGFPGCSSLVRQCVPVTEGESYRVEARVRIEPGQAPGEVLLRVSWRNASACYPAAPAVGQSAIPATAITGDWELVGDTVTAPVGAKGADLQLAVLKDSASGSFAVRFDAVSMPEADAAVSALTGLAVLAGLRLSRRRRSAAG